MPSSASGGRRTSRPAAAWGDGDEGALEQLVPLVHRELRRMAHRAMAGERTDHALEPTALVDAGGHTGWHSHPGPALVLVTEGQLTLYSSDDPTCTGRTYTAGQAFVDPGQGHSHIGRASQTQSTVVWVTYFDVPPGGGVRIDGPDPGTCFF